MAPTGFSTIPLALILIILLSDPGNARCYYPDGSIARNSEPCRDDETHSACCMQGFACLSNGICQLTEAVMELPPGREWPEYYRGACTDQSWRSSGCPLFCLWRDSASYYPIAKCENATEDMYYCDTLSLEGVDCDQKLGLLYFPGTASVITTIGVSPTITSEIDTTTTTASDDLTSTTPTDDTTSTPTSTGTTTSDETPTGGTETPSAGPAIATPQPSPSPSVDKGAIIGGAVGGALGIFILGGLALWWFLSRFRRKLQFDGRQSAQYDGTQVPPPAGLVAELPYQGMRDIPPQELSHHHYAK